MSVEGLLDPKQGSQDLILHRNLQEALAVVRLHLAEMQPQREQRRRWDKLDVATGMERTVVR